MVDDAIVTVVRKYLAKVAEAGIVVDRGVIFGSCAHGCQRTESDIDLVVISPAFDGKEREAALDTLWHMVWRVDTRIEPIGVGVRQYEEQAWQPLLMVARREGVSVYPAGVPAASIAADGSGAYRPRRQPRRTVKKRR